MMTKSEKKELDKEVVNDCKTIIERTNTLLDSYTDGDLESVKRTLSSLTFWVNSVTQDILNGIDFKEREIM